MRKDEFPIVDKLVKDSINEVLDKIEAEIKELFKGPAYYIPNYEAYKQFLEIINKYREGEDKG